MQHINVVTDSHCQRTTRTAFADDGTQYRHMQAGQFVQITADGFGLTALFRANARIRARSIDKGHDRNIEFLGSLHQAQRFTVTFGTRHTEIAADFFFGIAAFLMANDHHALTVETCQTADNSMIVRIMAVAVQLFKIGKNTVDVVQSIRTLRMAGHL